MKLNIQCFVIFAALFLASTLPFSSSSRPEFVEPKCGKLGCCYYTHGFCAKCCEPQGGSYDGGEGGGGGDGSGFVEPDCGDLGCCYHKYGHCAGCCQPQGGGYGGGGSGFRQGGGGPISGGGGGGPISGGKGVDQCEFGCCYAKYGSCLQCCKPWWVPPVEVKHDVPLKN